MRVRAGRAARRLLPFSLLAALVLAAAGSVPAAPLAGSNRPASPRALTVYEIRSIPTREFGVRRPMGLAYVPRDRSLVVSGSSARRTRLVRLTLYEDLVASLRTGNLSHPSTLTFDPVGHRLTAFDRNGRLRVPTPAGRTGTTAIARDGSAGLELGDARAATFDPKRKAWLVLDARARAIVRMPAQGSARLGRVPLRIPGVRKLAGLAYNPADGLLYVTSPADSRLYALDRFGEVAKVYSLKALRLQDARAILFAPSADPTDDPKAQHLYIADAGARAGGGRIVEATLTRAPSVFATTVIGTWIGTIQTSQYGPPSPDPAGIAYVAATDRFLISDSEVDEMTIYQGSNLYTATRSASGSGTGTTLPWSQEPTGVGYDPASGTAYISDDDRDRIFVDRPGPDGRHGTSDDTVTFFSTSAFGSGDAEGVEYDPETGHLFISDGVALEVFRVNPVNGVFGDGNDVVTSFDIGQYGARDAEGIGIDTQRGLLVVVDPSTKSLYELTKSGTLIRIIDCRGVGPAGNRAFAGVTMAPTSNPNDAPTAMNFWIVDRQVDNGSDPNENDGKLYEVSAPSADTPPTVSVTAPAEGATIGGTVTVAASASDNAGVSQVAFAVDGTPIGTDTNGADGWSTSWNTTTATDGLHTVTATATDTVGQTGSDSNGVRVDNTPPTVAVTSPAEGATVTGTVAVQATASDANGVTQVAFSVSGIPIGTDTNGTNGWSVSWNTTTFTDGPRTVTATATDAVGRTASDSNTVSVDNTAPTVTLTAPAEGATVSGTVAVEATASDASGVTQVAFSVDGTPIGTDTNGTNGWSVSWNSATVADGLRTVTATATDTTAHTASDSNAVTVANAVTAPLVTVTAPAEDALVSGTVAVHASAVSGTAVTRVAFEVDGTPIGTDTNGADGWSVSWNSATVADGARTVTATATDTLEQTGSDSNGITVDNTDPTVTLTAPAEGATVSGTTTLQATATDASGVTQVAFSVNGTPIGTDTNGTNGWSVSWNSATVADGARTLTATATDGAANTGSDSNGVTVDNTDPTVTLTAPAEGATVSGTTTLQATATDASGVTQVAFSVNGTPIGTDTNGTDGWSVSWNSATVADGARTLTATATDGAANTGSDSNGVTVDNTDPTVTLTAPAEGATVSGTTTLQATATDASGVTQVAFSVNGTPIGTDTNGTNGWSVSWNTTTVADGAHTVTATATDGLGHTGSDSNSVTVDNTAPAVSVVSPAAGSVVEGTVSVEALALDAGTVSSVQFFVDGASIGTDTNGTNGWSVPWNTTTVADGSHDVTATASDAGGNVSTSAPVQVTVDNPNIVTLTAPIRAGLDDADELQSGAVMRTGGDIELGVDHGVPTTVGLRFAQLPVPPGATVVSASIQFTTDENGKDVSNLIVRAEAADNSGGNTSTAFSISSRPRTTASTAWSAPKWNGVGSVGPAQRTPDLSAVLQEVVGRPGWASNNALMIIITGSGRRTAESFEGGFPPVLHVEYAID